MARVLVDYHHSSLLRSLVMLFEERLNMEVYCPIGLEWFEEGYWKINDQADTAQQYLSTEGLYTPKDGTPILNKIKKISPRLSEGVYKVNDPGEVSSHWACSLEYFKNNKFDYLVASIPAHIKPFQELIDKYQPQAKLIVQMGNMWPDELFRGHNVLASVQPRLMPANAIFYHQEFDLNIFRAKPVKPTKKIHSFINILQGTGQAWRDFLALEKALPGYQFKSYGGQCRDENMDGPVALSNSIGESQFVFHVKPGGDGFGHIIHNAYAMGRPVITRPSHYQGQLAEQLLVPGTFINLDSLGRSMAQDRIVELTVNTGRLEAMSAAAAARFKEVVNYEQEAKEIESWLTSL